MSRFAHRGDTDRIQIDRRKNQLTRATRIATRWGGGATRALIAISGLALVAACTVKETVVYRNAPAAVSASPQFSGSGVWASHQVVGTCTTNATRGGLPLPSGQLCCKANIVSPAGRNSQNWTLYYPGTGPGKRIPVINASSSARDDSHINRYYCTPR